MDCIFCKIVSGEIPVEKVYEDENFLGFLDISPVNLGHLLLIPKQHYEMMVDVPDKLLCNMIVKSKELMGKIKIAMDADFVVLSVVGIDVLHFHIHLIPRKHGDGLTDFWPTKKYKDGKMGEIGRKLREALG